MKDEILDILKNKKMDGNDIIRKLNTKRSPRYIYGYLDCLSEMGFVKKTEINKKLSYFEMGK